MKKFNLKWRVLPILASLCFVSCNNEEDAPIPTLSVSPTSITLSGSGENDFFDIESNTDWTIEVGDDWVTVSQEKGSENASIEVRAAENPKESKRTTNITVTAGDLRKSIRITQEAGEILRVSPTDLQVSADIKENAGSFTIQISSAWSISGLESASWLSLSSTEGIGNTTIVVNTTEKNLTAETRSVTLTITSGTKSATITLTQVATYENLHVSLANEIILSNGFYADLVFDSNILGYIEGYYYAEAFSVKTEEEIYNEVLDGTSYSAKEYNFTFMTLPSANTNYIYCCIPYSGDSKSRKYGPLFSYTFQTKSIDTKFDASITSSYTSSYWNYTITKQPRCHHFYALYTTNYDAEDKFTTDDIILASIIQEEINEGGLDYAINDGSSRIPRTYNDYAFFSWTWGVGDNGEFSGNIRYTYQNTTYTKTGTKTANAHNNNKELQPAKKPTRQQLDELSKNFHIIKIE